MITTNSRTGSKKPSGLILPPMEEYAAKRGRPITHRFRKSKYPIHPGFIKIWRNSISWPHKGDGLPWNSKREPKFTWEREDEIRAKYPHLFSIISSKSN
ncbi:hypothetical protein Tco_0079010 [Tanacetum coccineum]